MPHHGQILRQARLSAGLDVEAMGALLERPPDDVLRAEEGRVVHSSLLQNYAQIFGLNVRALLRGDAEEGPAALLFRSMTAHGSDLQVLSHTQVHRVLGRFMQRVRDMADLRTALSIELPQPSEWPRTQALPATPGKDSVVSQAEKLALDVRRWLGLSEDEPIQSALALVRERFGVEVFFVDIETLARQIDGASTLHPTPAILVNLVGGPNCWWHTRMTLIHELCHLLFDRDIFGRSRAGEFLFFSPEHSARKAGRWRLVERFDDAEQRANAFAACLLAPSSGVRRIVGADKRPRPSHVERVQERYGIGRTAALNRLQDACSLSESQRYELERSSQPTSWRLPTEHPDAVPEANIGLCSLQLRALVDSAVARGVLDGVEARRMLGLDLSCSVGSEAPLRPRWRGVADAAVLFAQQHAPELGATFAGQVREAPAGGFEVELCEMTAEGRLPLGVLRLSEDMEVQNQTSWRGAGFSAE